ncbi:hypothetical protein PGIGA_G00253580 [Pangasianodon gigas]|uniref:Uncharacterized protein n=1 Tax=Pangasianodon gigas TaxID=30993 RepID=A0ACC5WRR3_PANGG|nr:hypothetical protein [Pangasianodon gigas]
MGYNSRRPHCSTPDNQEQKSEATHSLSVKGGERDGPERVLKIKSVSSPSSTLQHSSNMEQKTTSPQKHMVKSRSKSTEEIQQAKKAFYIPQKSLPGGSDLDKVKGGSGRIRNPHISLRRVQVIYRSLEQCEYTHTHTHSKYTHVYRRHNSDTLLHVCANANCDCFTYQLNVFQ